MSPSWTPRAERRAFGRRAEEFACAWLERRGARVVARNVHLRHAELDVIAMDGDALCFVEVRARRGALASAFESVDRRKQQRIIRAAAEALARFALPRHARVRFDVIAVDPAATPPAIEWLRDAFHVK